MKDVFNGLARALGVIILYKLAKNPIRTIKGRLVFGRWDISIFGEYSVVEPNNVRVGAKLAVNHGVFILGRNGIAIGDNVILAARCMLLDGEPGGQGSAKSCKSCEESKIEIGNSVLIGAGAIILPGVKIGDDAVVAAGALVAYDVGAGTTVIGNPARRVWG